MFKANFGVKRPSREISSLWRSSFSKKVLILLNSGRRLLERNFSFFCKCQLNSNVIKSISMNKTFCVAHWRSFQRCRGLSPPPPDPLFSCLIRSSLELCSNFLSPHTCCCLPISVPVVSGPKHSDAAFRVWSSACGKSPRSLKSSRFMSPRRMTHVFLNSTVPRNNV